MIQFSAIPKIISIITIAKKNEYRIVSNNILKFDEFSDIDIFFVIQFNIIYGKVYYSSFQILKKKKLRFLFEKKVLSQFKNNIK